MGAREEAGLVSPALPWPSHEVRREGGGGDDERGLGGAVGRSTVDTHSPSRSPTGRRARRESAMESAVAGAERRGGGS